MIGHNPSPALARPAPHVNWAGNAVLYGVIACEIRKRSARIEVLQNRLDTCAT